MTLSCSCPVRPVALFPLGLEEDRSGSVEVPFPQNERDVFFSAGLFGPSLSFPSPSGRKRNGRRFKLAESIGGTPPFLSRGMKKTTLFFPQQPLTIGPPFFPPPVCREPKGPLLSHATRTAPIRILLFFFFLFFFFDAVALRMYSATGGSPLSLNGWSRHQIGVCHGWFFVHARSILSLCFFLPGDDKQA